MPIKVRDPEPPLDFVIIDGQLWEFNREESSGTSPMKNMTVLVNVRTGYECSFPTVDVKNAKRIPVANVTPANVPVSLECLLAESRACRSQWAVRPPV